MRALDILAETDREMRFSTQPRLLVELAAARICRAPEAAAAPAVVERAAAPAPAARKPEAAKPEPAAEKAPEEPAEQPAASGEPVTLSEIRRRWDEVLADLRKRKRSSEAAFLHDAAPVSLEEGVLMVEFTHQFHHDQMQEKRRQMAADSVGRVFGLQVVVKCRMASPTEAGHEAPPSGRRARKVDDVLSIFPGSELEE
jgi:DNA polymerase-3 subunit gamma/tau